jgi:hypothetical protein
MKQQNYKHHNKIDECRKQQKQQQRKRKSETNTLTILLLYQAV